MSPVRKPTGPKEWELKPRSPRSKEPQHRSGVNPSFVFLQLYHSAYFGTPLEKPLLVSNSQSALKTLDWIPPYEVHKRLGTLINLAEADRQHVFLGGLDTNGRDGKFAYIWQDDVLQVIFHVATLMPNLANDPKATNKKLHIGNNFVAIVYNDSGEEYNFQTLKAQFNYGVVVVEPLEHGCNQVVVKAREELVHHICHTEYKIVSDQSVAILARQLAVHANVRIAYPFMD
ncbi:hypothetical protein AAG570_005497 [Ranatra chinensis]|uniref:Rap-GAP domain-containing protein n=1 Tax=Ranatra chinensis TaxID=642074 RepID=A0ABD0XXL3_9HEMI